MSEDNTDISRELMGKSNFVEDSDLYISISNLKMRI